MSCALPTQLTACAAFTALLYSLPLSALAEEEEVDFHFRPFWVEPADRIEFGHGHFVMGLDYERQPEPGVRRRASLPLETTLGLGAGFSTVLAMEGAAYGQADLAPHHRATDREIKLRYSLPAWEGFNFLVFGGMSRLTGHDNASYSRGYAVAADLPVGTLSWSQTWDRKRPEEGLAQREQAVNFFRTGLGQDGRWAAGAEWHRLVSGIGHTHDFWLAGVGRVIGKNLMADVAIGGDTHHAGNRRLTTGLSWFF